MYAAFLEDPAAWALLAIGAALATGRDGTVDAAGAAADGEPHVVRGGRNGAGKPAAVPAATPPPAL
jgi:hypothetical protein